MLWLTIFYFLSRLPFLRAYPVYYDSFEYTRIAQSITFTNFSSIITSSHQPIHTFYFLTILFFKRIFLFVPTNISLVLISLFFGYFTLIVWYLFVKKLANQKIAFWAGFLLLLFPYFFRANTNILYESELLFLQISALFFFLKCLKENKLFLVLLAGLSWGLSISLFTGSLLIFPVFLLFYSLLKRSLGRSANWRMKRLKVSLGGLSPFSLVPLVLFGLLVPLSLDLLFLKDLSIILTKYQPHLSDIVSLQGGILVFSFRILRNIFLQSSAILSLPTTIILILLLFVSTLHHLSSRSTFCRLSSIVWLIPPFFLMQFWHSGLYGRLGLFIIFPVSLLLAENLTKIWQKYLTCLAEVSLASLRSGPTGRRRWVFLILLVFLVLQFLSQHQTPPIYRFYSLIENEPKEKIAIITSDSNRFLYQKNNLTTLVVNPGIPYEIVEKFIYENQKSKRLVLIDSQAITAPYYQFDGDYYQLLSRNKKGIPALQSLLKKFKLEPFKTDPRNKNIFFKKIYFPKSKD